MGRERKRAGLTAAFRGGPGPGRALPLVDTNFVLHEIRVMKKNITVTLDEDTARWVRVEAARAEVSVSRYLGRLLEERRRRSEGYETARRRFMSREPRPLRSAGTELPRREVLHERGSARGGKAGGATG
jgi:hypothetical protein